MTAIIIINIIFCAFVTVGILGLLAFGILTDRVSPSGRRARRAARARVRAHAQPGYGRPDFAR